MTFVIDASITACWLMPDEGDDRAASAFEQLDEIGAIAPALWWFEARNVLVMNERRGRIDLSRFDRAVDFLNRLPIHIDRELNEAAMLHLARRHRLTVYDAAYLELALRRAAPLATLDKALAAAARAENVALVGA